MTLQPSDHPLSISNPPKTASYSISGFNDLLKAHLFKLIDIALVGTANVGCASTVTETAVQVRQR